MFGVLLELEPGSAQPPCIIHGPSCVFWGLLCLELPALGAQMGLCRRNMPEPEG